MKSVIFVCLGNICRSPLAEGVAKDMLKRMNLDNIKIESAGLSKYHNSEQPCIISQELAKKNGIDISNYKSTHISEFNLEKFDLIVALDESNKKELLKLGYKKVKKLGEFGFNGKDVADLYYYPHKEDEVWNMVTIGVKNILEELK